MPEVFNTQRKIQIEVESIRKFADRIATEIPEVAGKDFSIAFIPDHRMKQLNEMFRGINSTTDVLSFPHEPDEFESNSDAFTHSSAETPEGVTLTFLGDIVISVDQAQKQAVENDLKLEN